MLIEINNHRGEARTEWNHSCRSKRTFCSWWKRASRIYEMEMNKIGFAHRITNDFETESAKHENRRLGV